MKELFISWTIGMIMMLGGGFFVYRQVIDIIAHAKKYRDEKAENKLRWWYLEWTFILWDMLLGAFVRPSLITSLIVSVIGTLIIVAEMPKTIRIVASLFD